MPVLGITGSTGALGGLVATLLAGAGLPQRLLVRDPSRAPELPGAEVRRVDYADTGLSASALARVEVLLMVSAGETEDRVAVHRSMVEAAVQAGVGHVVYTSFLGASPDSVFTLGRDHGATEQLISDSGLRHTFLRDNFYLEAFGDFVGSDDVLRGPAGDGRVSAVSREDVARAAVAVLTEPDRHQGAAYPLTGPVALSLAEIAATLSRFRHRPVRYHPETLAEAYASRASWDPEPWQADAWVSTYTSIASGDLAPVSDAVSQLTGREPLGLEQLLGQRRPDRDD